MIEFAPGSEREMTYDDAILYCQFLEYNGHRDWRLPTRQEYEADIANGSAMAWRWFTNRNIDHSAAFTTYWVLPVRDI